MRKQVKCISMAIALACGGVASAAETAAPPAAQNPQVGDPYYPYGYGPGYGGPGYWGGPGYYGGPGYWGGPGYHGGPAYYGPGWGPGYGPGYWGGPYYGPGYWGRPGGWRPWRRGWW